MKPIPFSSFGGYRAFCWPWWKDLGRTLTVGWFYDIKTYWHRARYGWAPKDTWSFDDYLAGVLGGGIKHLADHLHGAPNGYPSREAKSFDAVTDFEQWEKDLRRWAEAFRAFSTHDYYEKHGSNYDAWHKDEEARGKAMQDALTEITPWFQSLWD